MLRRILCILLFISTFSITGFAQNGVHDSENNHFKQFELDQKINSKAEFQHSKAYQFSKALSNNSQLIELMSLKEGVNESVIKRKMINTENERKSVSSFKRRGKVANIKSVLSVQNYNWDGTNKLGLVSRSFHTNDLSEDSMVTWWDYYQVVDESGDISDDANYLLYGDLKTNRVINQHGNYYMEEGEWMLGYDYFYEHNSEGRTTNFEYKTRIEGDWKYEYKDTYEYNSEGYTSEIMEYEHRYGAWAPSWRYTFSYKEMNGEDYLDERLAESYDEISGTWNNAGKNIYTYNSDNQVIVFQHWDDQNDKWVNQTRRTYYLNENGLDTLFVREYYDQNKDIWYKEYRELTTYNADGWDTEYYSQFYDTTNQEWNNLEKTVTTYNGNYVETEKNYIWSPSDNDWIYDGFYRESTFNSEGEELTYVYKYYNEGALSYGFKEEYEYDSDGYMTIKKHWEIQNDGTEIPFRYTERQYTDGYIDESPLLSLSKVEDLPNDQGGFVQFSIGGQHATNGEVDLNTSHFNIWSYNGSYWENVKTVTYEPRITGNGNMVSVSVPFTMPLGADSANYAQSFKVTAHTAKGDMISTTGVESGVAIDNIAPAKVENVSASKENDQISMSWDPNSSSDVDGYFVFIESEDGTYDTENSIGFSESTSLVFNKPNEKGDYEYVVLAIDKHQNVGAPSEPTLVSITTANELTGNVPEHFELSQNYPNPFNPTTEISYALPDKAQVKVSVFNMLGQKVSTLINRSQNAGYHSVKFDAANLTSGTYFYRIEAGSFTETKKMMLIK